MTEPTETYWRSLDELNASEFIDEASTTEFADTPLRHPEQADRRDFLKCAGFVLAGSAFTACSRAPVEQAIPPARQAEGLIAGRSYQFATICGGCSAGCGVLAKVRDGRPIKLEGNPDHPLALGGLCAVGQASILGLYDSQRLRQPMLRGKAVSWGEADRHIVESLERIRREKGTVRVLTSTLVSPSLKHQIQTFLRPFSDARHVVFDPLSVSSLLDAYQSTFNVRRLPHFQFAKARVIASFDADFLGTWISPSEFTRGYRISRTEDGQPSSKAWHTQIESRFSLTGTKADERIPLAPNDIASALELLVSRLASRAGSSFSPASVFPEELSKSSLDGLVDRLWNARGESLVLCGLHDVEAQRLCVLANELLGNHGATLDLDRPSLQRQGSDRELHQLLNEIDSGRVAALFVMGLNPAADLPLSSQTGNALRGLPLFVSLAPRQDETSDLAGVICPDSDPLESWGDAEPVAGLVSLQQPAVRPLGNSRPALESFAQWAGTPAPAFELVRAYWRDAVHPRGDGQQSFDTFWQATLQTGFAQVRPDTQTRRLFARHTVQPLPARSQSQMMALVLYPKAGMLDGRHAYNPWLHEMPDPVTKATWDNYACLSPAKALELGVNDGDLVRVSARQESVELPVLVQPGQHASVVAIALGYGRQASRRFERIGPKWLHARSTTGPNGMVGLNVSSLLEWSQSSISYTRDGVSVTKTGRRRELGLTQTHHTLTVPPKLDPGGPPRPIVQETALNQIDTGGSSHPGPAHAELWPPDHPYSGHRWAMAIDMDACTGCSACVVACQVENNVPVAGKDEVIRSREMHWIRIDRYYSGPPDSPRVAHQPMMCQHCEHAPCETVCPVLATVHSSEGLNQQVYNRCVGTRYCANNCPYKVRRFNWFEYQRDDRLANLVLNPDVTVRSRGVMEKCSFCVQRIQEARMEAKRLGKAVQDGDVVTACQQTCPAQAIAFGDLNDSKSIIAKWVKSPRQYRVLEELNVRPSVHYLKVVRRDEKGLEGELHG